MQCTGKEIFTWSAAPVNLTPSLRIDGFVDEQDPVLWMVDISWLFGVAVCCCVPTRHVATCGICFE